MGNTKVKKPHTVCTDVEDLVVGDVLVWDNTNGDTDCVATECTPGLEYDSYTIPAHQKVEANAVTKTNKTYHCKCDNQGKENDPKLIVS